MKQGRGTGCGQTKAPAESEDDCGLHGEKEDDSLFFAICDFARMNDQRGKSKSNEQESEEGRRRTLAKELKTSLTYM